MFDGDITSEEKFCPDWLADSDVVKISRWFPGLVAVSLLAPALIGGLWSMSWQGAVTAFFWATLVRIAFLHHITWSINSICHTFGKEEFEVRDKSRNVSWLAILSFGESWHNLHHADPTCARHGVLKGQIDIAARTIWLAETLGWVYDVRWPDAARLTGKQTSEARKFGSMTRRETSQADGRLTRASTYAKARLDLAAGDLRASHANRDARIALVTNRSSRFAVPDLGVSSQRRQMSRCSGISRGLRCGIPDRGRQCRAGPHLVAQPIAQPPSGRSLRLSLRYRRFWTGRSP